MPKKQIRVCCFLAIGLLFVLSCDRRPIVDRKLTNALEAGNTNYLRQFFARGGDVNRAIQYVPFGRISAPPLDVAIRHGQIGTMTLLLENGADPNRTDSEGKTPLMWVIGQSSAPQKLRVEMLKTLLKAGADPNKASSNYRSTPLLRAAEFGQSDMVKILLDAGAEVKATNVVGFSSLHLAKNAEIVRLLIAAGADPTVRTTEGETPVDTARRQGRLDALGAITNGSANRH